MDATSRSRRALPRRFVDIELSEKLGREVVKTEVLPLRPGQTILSCSRIAPRRCVRLSGSGSTACFASGMSPHPRWRSGPTRHRPRRGCWVRRATAWCTSATAGRFPSPPLSRDGRLAPRQLRHPRRRTRRRLATHCRRHFAPEARMPHPHPVDARRCNARGARLDAQAAHRV